MNEELYTRYPQLLSCKDSIEEAYSLLRETYESGGKLLLCGNGGSASDCCHIVGELMKGFLSRRPLTQNERDEMLALNPQLPPRLLELSQRALPAVNLCESAALLSAFANDVEPEFVFAQQVLGLGKPGDALIGISTSGNSRNVLAAMHMAKARGLRTIALAGRDGGEIAKIADAAIVVPERETFKIQELHLPVYHYLCARLERYFFETR